MRNGKKWDMAVKIDKTRFTREFANKSKLVHFIDRAIERTPEFEWEAKFSPKKPDKGFHPSSDCLPSALNLYQSIAYPEARVIGCDLKKTFTVGHFWHQYLQYVLVELLEFASWDDIERHATHIWGDGKDYEFVSGSTDAICNILDDRYLIDIKTQKSIDFRLNHLPEWCADKYRCQINIYMDLFDIDQAIILCVNKDSPHNFKEYMFARDQKLIDAIYKKWKIVGECLKEGVEPTSKQEVILPL